MRRWTQVQTVCSELLGQPDAPVAAETSRSWHSRATSDAVGWTTWCRDPEPRRQNLQRRPQADIAARRVDAAYAAENSFTTNTHQTAARN